jgi:hypothetical protein
VWLVPQLTGPGALLGLLAAAQLLPCCCWDLMAAWSATARARRPDAAAGLSASPVMTSQAPAAAKASVITHR